jgi:hypothetical protein
MIKIVQSGSKLEDLSKVKAGEGIPDEFIGCCGSIIACLNCGCTNEKAMKKIYVDWMKVDF